MVCVTTFGRVGDYRRKSSLCRQKLFTSKTEFRLRPCDWQLRSIFYNKFNHALTKMDVCSIMRTSLSLMVIFYSLIRILFKGFCFCSLFNQLTRL